MGRPESALDPASGPVQSFAFELRKLRQEAGGLTYRAMARRTPYSPATLSRAAAGEHLPSLAVALAYAQACGADPAEWERRWREAERQATAAPPRDQDDPSPYRGLARYETDDRHLFFGRDQLTARLAERVLTHRLVAVVGPSGSGKSSLLRAGLIPRLQSEEPPERRPAAIRILTPGPHPMSAHATVGQASRGPGDTVVLVDQFEELFTLCADPAERQAYLDLLLTALRPEHRLRVVIVMRTDFFGHCARHPALAAALSEATLLVGPMTPAELRRAVVGPATATGLIVERQLTARIVEEASGKPGGLPLMSHALLETWRRRSGRTLTLAGYEAPGGLQGALSRTAEDLYARLSAAQADRARKILLRLVTPGQGTQDTRRPADREELRTDGSSDTDEVLEQLVRARLVTVDGSTVHLAHEAILTAWPRLRNWIDEARERLRVHRLLTEAARVWDALDRDPGALYRGVRLVTAEEVFDSPEAEGELTPLERDFLVSSVTARDREQRMAAVTTLRLRRLTVLLSVLLAVAVTAGLIAWNQYRSSERRRQEAVTAQRTARSRELAAESSALLRNDPDLASLLAVQAYRLDPTAEATASLYAAAALPLRHRLTGHTAPVDAVVFAPGGRTVAGVGSDGRVRVWDAATGEVRAAFRASDGAVRAVAYRPDGRLLAVTNTRGTLLLTDLTKGRVRTTAVRGRAEGPVVFAPGGRTVAGVGYDGRIRVWDAATGEVRAAFRASDGAVRAVAYRPDGRVLAVANADGTIRLHDLSGGRTRAWTISHATVTSMAFSPDGRLLAVGDLDGSVRLTDTGTGARQALLAGHTGPVYTMSFSPDGRVLATAGADDTARLWDASTGKSRAVLTGHRDSVSSLSFSPDGGTLATGSRDRTVRLWQASTARPDTTRTGSATISSLAFGEDGRTLAIGDVSGAVRVRDAGARPVRRARRPRSAPAGTGSVVAVGRGPDGRIMAALTSGDARTVRLWDPTGRTLRTVVRQRPVADTVLAAAISPDGRTLATGGTGTTVRLWDVATGRCRTVLTGATDVIVALAFGRDGHTLVSADADGAVRLWDPASGRAMAVLADQAVSVAPSADGSLLATGHTDGTIRVWDVAAHAVRAAFWDRRTAVTALAFSPDRRALAAGGVDGTVQVWKPALPGPAETIDSVCRALHRDFTPQERLQYVRGGPQPSACTGRGG
ncbi:helix-turn-helix domain-containing protein [Streptomyces misionensis]|uniref:Helix-turn-helix domain-containing protein n=1 Tax=Streptomyces misionensis TaxID=67331 RepID=A0A5C6IN23_9ACTN|nr:helix-turn-helix domain-containing protein [Streptomyces misionensis]TWV29527.1 helix-turn-helix domain-containing protein [Streptomyces misionensis]